ncbi:cilium assembly protein DZIP1 [Clinocottus analis]|uniref:cilium assembly protein DZIP1 n=1 Tax=Clinocottus analis TaxID=304258 RepID=UPI0035BF744B
MPFHEGEYYAFTGDTQGTHSSAGIPTLMNSPLSQRGMTPLSNMTPSSGAAFQPFHFRPRRERVNWRRISAVDIDLVVSQMDLDVLQEHINGVTFCSLDGELCQRCQSPVDPTLIKLLKLAQLTVEWLLHCQGTLTHSLHTLEERLTAAGREREQLLAQQKKQEERAEAAGREHQQLLAQQKEKVKMMTAELKQRTKMITTQQLMLIPQIGSGQKCPHCDKSFLNPSFLQSHMQRRHPDEYNIECAEKNSQFERLKSENSNLKEQVVQQKLDLEAKIASEKDQDRLNVVEMARMDQKIEDMRREMEVITTRHIQALNEANQNQTAKQEKAASPIPQPERDLDNSKELQIQKMENQQKKREKKWASRLQEMEDQRKAEKNQLLNELSRLQSSVSEHQESSQRLQQEMDRRQQEMDRRQQELDRKLQKRDQTIKAQREQMEREERDWSDRSLQYPENKIQDLAAMTEKKSKVRNSNPPIRVVQAPVMVSAPAPEPRPKRVVLDLSSFSGRRPAERKPKPARNPGISKEIRRALEQTVVEKLENLGVKSSGVKDKEFCSISAKLQKSSAKAMPDYERQREEITSIVERKLAERRGNQSAPNSQTRARPLGQVLQIRPRSSSLPSRVTQVVSRPAAKQPKTPQPAPRARTTAQPKTSTPKIPQRTFTSNSAEKSRNEEDSDVERKRRHQKHQRAKSPQPRASKASPVQSRQAQARHTFASNPQQARGAAKTAFAKMESDDEEWSEVSELQEIDPKHLQSFKDQNGNVDKITFGKENKIQDLTHKIEKKFAERAVKKPAGGVSVLPERKDEVQELTYEDLEESSAWTVSSEDRQETAKPAQGSGPARKSLDSPSTSAWGTSTGKGVKSGLTDAGTGSTLKSSLCSLSDISDSEDI